MPSAEFKSKRHDTGVSLPIDFVPPEGLTWDLEEPGIVVTFIARLPTEPAPKVRAAVDVTGPWSVRYDPTPDDVDEIGSFDVECSAVRADGKQVTLPTVGFLKWTISTDLDNQ